MHHLNTHTYDGQLAPLPVMEKIDKQEITELQKLITDPIALHYFNQIVSDQYNSNNTDKSNNLSAYDILLRLSINREKFPINLLIEQLCDMATGFCPEGRSTRLYQLLVTIDY